VEIKGEIYTVSQSMPLN